MKKILHTFFLTLLIAGTNQLSAQLAVGTTQNNVTCHGGSNGLAVAIPSGGTGHYSYAWSPTGGTNSSATGLMAGNYTVTLTDTISPATIDTFYFQNFEGAHGWTLNVSTGANGADPNFWKVSAAEGGVLPPGCGVANNGNKTLHITSVASPNAGAAYDAGGLCGILYCPLTNARAESPVFSTVGSSGIKLEFDFIANGDAMNDNASVWYNDGTGWTSLTASIKSTLCGGGQGQWTHYNVSLPASCDNNATVQVAINWSNNDDGVGTDPSVAVNNVLVSQAIPPVLQTATATVTITEPAAIDVSTSSSGNVITATATPATYQWINCNTGNSVIAGETNQTYTASANGSYAVIVTQGACSDTSACVNISNIGTSAVQMQNDIFIYPNPAANQFTIETNSSNKISMDLYDLSGRHLLNKNATGTLGVNVANLEEGVYTIVIKTSGRTLTKKLVIVR